MGSVSILDDPLVGAAKRDELAALYAAGADRKSMAEHFDVHVDTITTWTGRPDIQALITEKVRQRANRMVRSIDATLEGRLQNAANIDTKDLLDIRKALVPQRVKIDDDRERDTAMEELTKEFLSDLDDAASDAAESGADEAPVTAAAE